MASAPSSPQRHENKENQVGGDRVKLKDVALAKRRRHSLAPFKSILKNLTLHDTEANNTITIMQKLEFRQVHHSSNRRVSFAPEVTLHKIDMLPLFLPSPKRQPRRRDTIQFVPPVRRNEDEFEDQYDQQIPSDMDIDDDDDQYPSLLQDASNDAAPPFVIYQDEDLDLQLELEMDLKRHTLKVDEVDQLERASSGQDVGGINDTNDANADMELTSLQYNEVEDMELTVHQAVLEPADDMELTVHHSALEPAEEMELTIHQTSLEPMELTEYRNEGTNIVENQEMHQEMHQDMELTSYQGQIRDDPMELTVYQGKPIDSHTEQGSNDHNLSSDNTNKLIKNPAISRIQRKSNSSFDSTIEEHESMMEVTTTAFGDPSIFEDILRVTGGSQEEEANQLPTPAKRSYSTPRKSLTSETGSPQERSSSLKKRRLSFPAHDFSHIEQPNSPIPSSLPLADEQEGVEMENDIESHVEREEVNSAETDNALEQVEHPQEPPTKNPVVEPVSQEQIPTIASHENPSASNETTPVKESLLLKSPLPATDSQSSIQELIQSLTPNRTRRESFGYTSSQSPHRRRSFTEEPSLTSLRVAKEDQVTKGALNLQKAVVTTTIPLAGNDDSQDFGDITDDYIPADLKTFLKSTGVKFYDDLIIRDNFDEQIASMSHSQSPDLQDYLIALQKLKQFELINFSSNELKKNITQGRSLFENLEKEIAEENPPLVREYFEADFEVQNRMNLQFQILKNYARQQAKNVWYNWRSKLVAGVHQSLVGNQLFLKDNKEKIELKILELSKEREEYLKEFEILKLRFSKLTKHKNEFDQCDKDELMGLRDQLISVFDLSKERQTVLEQLQLENSELSKEISKSSTKIESLKHEISQIEMQIRENQIFDKDDIEKMKLQFSVLERSTGLKLQDYNGSSNVKMAIDNVVIDYHMLTDHCDFVIGAARGVNASPLMTKLQPRLVEQSFCNSVERISNFLTNYRALKKLNDKLEILRLSWDGPMRYIEAPTKGDGETSKLSVQLKCIGSTTKKLISFEIKEDQLSNFKVKLQDLQVERVSYVDEPEQDSTLDDDDIDQDEDVKLLVSLLRELELM